MRQLAHFIAQGYIIGKRARVTAGFKVTFRVCCHVGFSQNKN
jgi:hypothetical protein